MASTDAFRLRLLIRRYALPDLKLVWPCTPSDDLTIARLLSAVNEVIPLESQDWGLEDYAVELFDAQGSNFECLHFQRVNQILKHDDQVLIRSLLTDDLKRRRVSGRDQISSDGKHLFDGVPFGRPLLKAPRGRPAVSLPPRKRARIEYQPDDTDDGIDEQQQLLLEHSSGRTDVDDTRDVRIQATFDDDVGDEDDEDSDFGDEDEEDEEPDVSQLGVLEDDELEQLRQDNAAYNEGAVGLRDSRSDVDSSYTSSSGSEDGQDEDLLKELQLLNDDDRIGGNESENGQLLEPDNPASALESIRVDWSEKLMILRTAFPLTPLPTIRKEFLANAEDLRLTYNNLCLTNNPVQSFDEMMDDALCGPDASYRPTQQAQPRSRPLIQEVESSDEPVASGPSRISEVHDASDGSSGGSSGSESTSESESESESQSASDSDSESDSRNENHANHRSGSRVQCAALSEEKAEGSGQLPSNLANGHVHDGRSDKDSTDSANRSDDSMDEALQDLTNDLLEDSEDESGDSDQSSESDASSDTESSSESSSDSDDDSTSDSSSDEGSDHAPPVPHTGTAKSTQGKDPRKASGTVSKEPSQPDQNPVPPGQGLSRTRKRNARRRLHKQLKKNGVTLVDSVSHDNEANTLEARRQALLQSLGLGATDIPKSVAESENTVPIETSAKVSGEDADTDDEPPTEEKSKGPEQRRTHLGAQVPARLISCGPGEKAPTILEEKNKLSEGLMVDVPPAQPAQNTRLTETNGVQDVTGQTTRPSSLSSSGSSSDTSSDSDEEDPDAWKKNITYRAVECVQQGIVLSEPPFPFKQRWDPQQHYSVVRKRKREVDTAPFDESFVGDETQWLHEEEETQPKSSKKRKRKGKQTADAVGEPVDDVVALEYDDPPHSNTTDNAAVEPAEGDTQVSQLDDLPGLPEDLSTLPLLGNGEAKPGMVITWKEYQLSKTTWEPQMACVTALVLDAEPGKPMRLILAKRDRQKDERRYDPETGERLYDKFEVPSDDDDEVEEDDGHRELSMLDMIEARIVQHPPGSPAADEEEGAGTVTLPDQPEPASPPHQSNDESTEEESTIIPSGQGPQQPQNPFHQLFPSGSLTMSYQAEQANLSKETTVEVTETVEDMANNTQDELGKDSAMDVDDKESEPTEMSDQNTESQALGGETQKSNEQQPSSVTFTEEQADDTQQDSLASGRQPGTESEQESAQLTDMGQDSAIPENLPSATIDQPQDTARDSTTDSSPMPSLEEIWHTAKAEKSPVNTEKSVIEEHNAGTNSDRGYEEAMARLDDGEVSDDQFKSKATVRRLFPNSTQPAKISVDLPAQVPDEARSVSVSTPPKRSQSKKARSSPFVLPAGSQIIDLDSDSLPAKGGNRAVNGGSARGRKKGSTPLKSMTRAVAQESSPPSGNTRYRKAAAASASQGPSGRGVGGRRASRGGRLSMTQQ